MSSNPPSSQALFRPPVVVVLGHVDHGKTSLLDVIRKTKIVEGESGGITQHIGAYQTEAQGKRITFLDTPGHEAFTSIRSRGAKVADVAILVVAAEEGIKPQTKEAIRILNEEKTPFVVAINKIDKEAANPQKVRQELAGEGVLVEDYGGTVPVVEISAKQNKNIDSLLEIILLLAELENLTEDVSLPAQGVIIESHLDKRRGYVATALVQKGVLEIGDFIVVGSVVGKIKSMEDFLGKAVARATPSQPVLITGWSASPSVGKPFVSAYAKDETLRIVESNVDFAPLFRFFKNPPVDPAHPKKMLNVVFKSDVASSLEAIECALTAIKSDEVGCRVMGFDVGTVSEADVKLAASSAAHIYAFRVDIDSAAQKMAEKNNVSLRSYDVIYELLEALRKDMGNLLDPEVRVTQLGKMRILAVFKHDGRTQIIGGKVTSGKAFKGSLAHILRGSSIVTTGKITQLQHNKEEVSEVREGLEAGLKFEPLADKPNESIQEGDIVELYEEEKVERSI